MKVLFTGGGTGGHFYPLLPIADELHAMLDRERLAGVEMYFMSDSPYDERALFEHKLIFKKIPTGKRRTYASFQNVLDVFKIAFACIRALGVMFRLYPDVVVGKGGYASFPALFAARMLRIPVIIHDSDTVPGRVNIWAGKFAKRIAISYQQAAEYFPRARTALTGQPLRTSIITPVKDGSHQFFGFDPSIPTILVVGGSQGALRINDTLLNALPNLIGRFQIIHQTGDRNLKEAEQISGLVLEKSPYKNRYKAFGTLDDATLVRAAGIADLVITRAGSTLFEIALWGIPSIVIPLAITRDQRTNAYTYARAGAAEVIEEANLSPHILTALIESIMDDATKRALMAESTIPFRHPDAARKIAEQVVQVLVEHKKMELRTA
ncbi:MAG: hypothetical protein A2408_01635 [Candidatus Yonathbacteria bacterium RIFOXYC1_FULL_52_10]|uniref:UDP-N-acetylglucosamine--N-acetylmuramyl-(pentapeptide) pyrophosphoryl-undecaprenol N-acetylglucosamine transferase n=1 Tax=Candidatus Yonathbacteria bacterium RIFOXYD1_FULL_52_36 TaxID=1802730 RepID=A0A1G2SME7_9BACT|nr:MAG: hypothetical protein A2408_01635 [Candidatus Yonathbacteria bacterium RIFOXYC1_FULL_52_10]OHA86187.1 MAG: hypothetical protein A2591_03845 [Candidatus Yonathbacteria bacterium RIFOXYD1_FULL_52_36]